jgi:hypothetical protein
VYFGGIFGFTARGCHFGLNPKLCHVVHIYVRHVWGEFEFVWRAVERVVEAKVAEAVWDVCLGTACTGGCF